jgi:hypothetical protein
MRVHRAISRLRSFRAGRRFPPWSALPAALFLLGVAAVALAGHVASAAGSFPDVPATHPYHAAILDLAGRGVIQGYSNGDFGPDDPVKRQQFAKMIVLTSGYPVTENDLCPFSDVEESTPPDLYPDHYVAVAATHGITVGTGPGLFSPGAFINRYQMISMVVRAAANLDPALLTTPPASWTGTPGWADNPTHGANARRAEYNGLLAGLPLSSLDPWGEMPRGEVAQVLHNLLLKLPTPTTTTTTASTTTTVPPHFEHLGGALTGSPAAITLGPNHLDVYVRGPDGALWHTYRNQQPVFSDWINLGGSIVGRPALTSAADWNIDVFAQGSANDLLHWHYGPWTGPESLGGQISSEPSSIDIAPGKAIIVVRGANSHVWSCQQTDTGVQWVDGGSPIASAPTVASLAGFSCFATAANGTLFPLDPPTGGPPGTVQGKPAVSTEMTLTGVPQGRFDVFARSTGNQLLHWVGSTIGGGTWEPAENLGGVVLDDPTVISWGYGHLEVFVRGPGNTLWHRTFQNGSWADWADLGGQFQGPPCAVSWGVGRIDVFGWGSPDNDLVHWWYDGRW